MWCDRTPRTASVKPQLIASSGTLNDSHVLVRPARISASACSTKYSAHAAAYAWKYVLARSRSIALDSGWPFLSTGGVHSNDTSGRDTVRGRLICTLCPVDFT